MTEKPRKSLTFRHRQPTFFWCEHPNVVVTTDATVTLTKRLRCEARFRLIAIEEVRNYGKIVSMKNVFENAWWEDAYPSSFPPWIRPWSYATETIKRVWYILVTWQLAPLVLFFFTKKQSQKGRGAWNNVLPLNTLLRCRAK